jgi:hypothetical protein
MLFSVLQTCSIISDRFLYGHSEGSSKKFNPVFQCYSRENLDFSVGVDDFFYSLQFAMYYLNGTGQIPSSA